MPGRGGCGLPFIVGGRGQASTFPTGKPKGKLGITVAVVNDKDESESVSVWDCVCGRTVQVKKWGNYGTRIPWCTDFLVVWFGRGRLAPIPCMYSNHDHRLKFYIHV